MIINYHLKIQIENTRERDGILPPETSIANRFQDMFPVVRGASRIELLKLYEIKNGEKKLVVNTDELNEMEHHERTVARLKVEPKFTDSPDMLTKEKLAQIADIKLEMENLRKKLALERAKNKKLRAKKEKKRPSTNMRSLYKK